MQAVEQGDRMASLMLKDMTAHHPKALFRLRNHNISSELARYYLGIHSGIIIRPLCHTVSKASGHPGE